MFLKNFSIILSALIFMSCGVSNRQKAEKKINQVKQQFIPDTREVIFDVYGAFENGKLVLKGETDRADVKNQLLKELESFSFKDKIVVLPDSTVGKNPFGLINLSVANLRSEPKFSAEMATQALLGTPVKILKKEGNWYRIQTPDRYISWVTESAVHPITEGQLQNWRKNKRTIFTKNSGTIYETEKFNKAVSDVTLGNILEELERSWRSVKVKFPDGRIGFTEPANWLDFDEFKNTVSPDTAKMAALATSFIGRPYLWGGTSARAMDCSGLVKTLYFMNGVILARDASQQSQYGELIDTENGFGKLQSGDLLFFGEKKTSNEKEKVTHVAFSLGKTEYIHSAGRVKENSFAPGTPKYQEDRKNSFIHARRMIGFEGEKGIRRIKEHPWY